MGVNSSRQRQTRPKALNNRVLRLEPLEPRLTLSANFLGLSDAALANYVRTLARDGSINRADMIGILAKVQNESDGVVDAADLRDLRKIVFNAASLKMPGYVSVLAGDIVNGNIANAKYQGGKLGNLAADDPNTKLAMLTSKWFYGTDLPTLPTNHGYTYSATSGTLWDSNGPWYTDEKQGELGDCYLLSALGSVSYSSKAAIRNMFIANGDGTWTVRFYSGGRVDYVTVNNQLPSQNGNLVFNGYRASCTDAGNRLWLSLLEKAYAQWNETGKTGRGSFTNSYAAIESGWTGNVYRQAVNTVVVYAMNRLAWTAQATLLDSLKSRRAVTIGTPDTVDSVTTGLIGGHAYNVLSYNAATGKYTLYNPWGTSQPNELTWAQLRANTDWFSATVPRAALNSVTMYIGAGHATRTAAAAFAGLTTTATTLDAPSAKLRAAAPLAPAAVDAALTNWDALCGDTWRQTATTRTSSGSAISDIDQKKSDDAFAQVDTLFDSIRLHAALFI
jgi:hypothetical protein